MNLEEIIKLVRATLLAMDPEERVEFIHQVSDGFCCMCGNVETNCNPCRCWDDS